MKASNSLTDIGRTTSVEKHIIFCAVDPETPIRQWGAAEVCETQRAAEEWCGLKHSFSNDQTKKMIRYIILAVFPRDGLTILRPHCCFSLVKRTVSKQLRSNIMWLITSKASNVLGASQGASPTETFFKVLQLNYVRGTFFVQRGETSWGIIWCTLRKTVTNMKTFPPRI